MPLDASLTVFLVGGINAGLHRNRIVIPYEMYLGRNSFGKILVSFAFNLIKLCEGILNIAAFVYIFVLFIVHKNHFSNY